MLRIRRASLIERLCTLATVALCALVVGCGKKEAAPAAKAPGGVDALKKESPPADARQVRLRATIDEKNAEQVAAELRKEIEADR